MRGCDGGSGARRQATDATNAKATSRRGTEGVILAACQSG